MTIYGIEIKKSARKDTDRFPKAARRAIASTVDGLRENPRARAKKVQGSKNDWRIRAGGTYRIIYEIDDSKETVTILVIGDRKDVYETYRRRRSSR